MKRYHSTIGPFMLTRLAVIVLGAQFMDRMAALDGRRFGMSAGADARHFSAGNMWHSVDGGRTWMSAEDYAEWRKLNPETGAYGTAYVVGVDRDTGTVRVSG